MKKIQPSNVHEVRVAWLRADKDSKMFGHHIPDDAVTRSLIESPDLQNSEENVRRKELLKFRGDSLEKLIEQADWWKVELSDVDLVNLLTSCYDTWKELTGGTRRIIIAARAIRDGHKLSAVSEQVYRELMDIQDSVRAIRTRIREDIEVLPPILVRCGSREAATVIEGIKRATACCWCYCLDNHPPSAIQAFLGILADP